MAGRASLKFGLAAVLASAVVTSGLAAADPSSPSLRLASIFQDHAVLQRDRPIAVWGRAAAGETVSVSMGGLQARARVDASGRWSVELPPMGAGGPFTLEARVASGAAQTLSDILVGDVFLCSGQSNMELAVSRSRGGEWAAARAADDRLRLLSPPTPIGWPRPRTCRRVPSGGSPLRRRSAPSRPPATSPGASCGTP